MYWAGGIVFRKNLTLRPATSKPCLSSFNNLCIENISEKPGLCRVAKPGYFYLF